jgi:hypothetical protein
LERREDVAYGDLLAVPVILLVCATQPISGGMDAQELHRFGETVALGANGSVVVTKRDVGEFRTRYPSEFSSAELNLVAYEFRFAGSKTAYVFATDRADPSRSDVVALCGSDRVNIYRLGHATFDDRNAYSFGRPSGIPTKDGRWVSVAAGGSPPLVVFFSLPAGCISERVRLLVGLKVSIARTEAQYQLLFGEEPPNKRLHPTAAGPGALRPRVNRSR